MACASWRRGCLRLTGLSTAEELVAGLQPPSTKPTRPGCSSWLMPELRGSSSVAANSKGFAAFEAVSSLLDTAILLPRTQAAFYQAVAWPPILGVVFAPDSADAAGRHGLGIAMTGATGERYQSIFPRAPAGTLVNATTRCALRLTPRWAR